MLSESLVLSMVIGIGVGYWCLRGSFCLGRDNFAYGPVDLSTWLMCGLYGALVSGAIFVNIFLINSSIDYFVGGLSNHLLGDVLSSALVAQTLIFAMIVEGARRRRRYYTLFVPWRRSWKYFSRRYAMRPSFWVLHPLW